MKSDTLAYFSRFQSPSQQKFSKFLKKPQKFSTRKLQTET